MPPLVRPLFALLTAALTAPAAAVPAEAASPASPYRTLAALEARVAAIGFRLTTANAGWCPEKQAQYGWIWGDPRLYGADRRGEALAAYGAAAFDLPFLAAVAPGSPAAEAGLRTGETITAVDDAAILVPADADDPFARITALETRMAATPLDAATIVSNAATRFALHPVAGCASDFRVEARDTESGAADGRLVLISAGLAAFAADDDELAAAVAHELAHNILRHRERLDAAGVDRGLFQNFGRSARLFRQTEVEADRLSIWLMRGAGYDPHAAIRFWERFGTRNGPVLIQPGTHPRWGDRVKSFEQEIAAIEAADAAGRPLRPPLIDAPPPLE
ncbi:peptidase M48, Ste24p [Sphingopyxis indica]|uniref:M48 family metalloprotease n=1 Tax=Sphingopyxis indica TaxID=436663 RepID=UPI0029390680|nr:M48 family metalloprotease [Sphingopyxis indica]WOF42783.1 peptidase M48, Ste24p [Sphingopyxis indica]